LDLSVASLVGGAAALCSMASFTPQIVKIWRERDASSVSLRMYVVTVVGFSLWTVYGVLQGAWPIILANAVCLGLSGAVLVLKWRFSRRNAPPGATGSRL
jgi:MtN3 and saliva related transmembrane protein